MIILATKELGMSQNAYGEHGFDHVLKESCHKSFCILIWLISSTKESLNAITQALTTIGFILSKQAHPKTSLITIEKFIQ